MEEHRGVRLQNNSNKLKIQEHVDSTWRRKVASFAALLPRSMQFIYLPHLREHVNKITTSIFDLGTCSTSAKRNAGKRSKKLKPKIILVKLF